MRDKFKKMKKSFLALALSVVLSCQGCSFAKMEIVDEDEKIKKSYDYLNDDNFIGYGYVKYFNEFEPVYRMKEELISESEIEEIISDYSNSDKCSKSYKYGDKFFNGLIEQIEENSKKYLKEHSEYFSAFPNGDVTEYGDLSFEQEKVGKQLLKVFQILTENSNNDLNDDFHRMQTLKIVSKYDSSLVYLGRYIEKDNVIIINVANILKLVNINGTDYETELYYVLFHEINHVRESLCDCRGGVFNSDLTYSNGFVSTLIETAAESAIYNQEMFIDERDPYFDYSYFSERKDESLLFLLALFNKNVTLDDYYNALFDTDVNKMFKFFDCYTTLEKYDLFKVMYIIDGLNSRSHLYYDCCDKYNLDSEKANVYDIAGKIGYGYRSEVFAKCLEDMVVYTNAEKDFSLKDNLMMYSIVRSKIVADEDCYSFNYPETSEDFASKYYFLKEIVTLNEMYMKFLMEYYNVSREEINKQEEEIFDYLREMIWFINKVDSSISQEVLNLLERFPMLEPILQTSSCDIYEFDMLLEQNKETVEHIKANLNIKKLCKK